VEAGFVLGEVRLVLTRSLNGLVKRGREVVAPRDKGKGLPIRKEPEGVLRVI